MGEQWMMNQALEAWWESTQPWALCTFQCQNCEASWGASAWNWNGLGRNLQRKVLLRSWGRMCSQPWSTWMLNRSIWVPSHPKLAPKRWASWMPLFAPLGNPIHPIAHGELRCQLCCQWPTSFSPSPQILFLMSRAPWLLVQGVVLGWLLLPVSQNFTEFG